MSSFYLPSLALGFVGQGNFLINGIHNQHFQVQSGAHELLFSLAVSSNFVQSPCWQRHCPLVTMIHISSQVKAPGTCPSRYCLCHHTYLLYRDRCSLTAVHHHLYPDAACSERFLPEVDEILRRPGSRDVPPGQVEQIVIQHGGSMTPSLKADCTTATVRSVAVGNVLQVMPSTSSSRAVLQCNAGHIATKSH